MTKEEKIIESYGVYWDEIKDIVNTDGWFYFHHTDFRLDGKMEFEYEHYLEKMRPKVLSGIENNNGWIKIETNEDLPKKDGEFKVVHKNGGQSTSSYLADLKQFFDMFDNAWDETEITHYRPLEKYQPPIY